MKCIETQSPSWSFHGTREPVFSVVLRTMV
jgi:hypothetical protein